MRVLMISLDGKVFDPASEVAARMSFYAAGLEELFIIVLNASGRPVSRGRLHLYPTSRWRILSPLRAWCVARKIVADQKIDIVSTQDPFVSGMVGYLLGVGRRRPKLQLQIHTGVFTPYFWHESLKNRIYVLMARFLLRRADCIKVVSQSIRDYLVERLKIPTEKISVLPVYIFLDHFQAEAVTTDLKKKYPRFGMTILMASRLVGQKNIVLAIEVVGELVKKYADLGLVIVGAGPEERSLKTKVNNAKLTASIVFEPWTDGLSSYYKTADVFLLTSTYEGWARTVLEAMACGLPVIMTDVGLAGEVLKDGENGVVVPVGDRCALSAAIEDLYLKPEKRKMLGEAGRATMATFILRDRKEYLRRYQESFYPCQKN